MLSTLDKAVASNKYTWLIWIAFAWVVFNCAYVYLSQDGRRTYRIESATIIALAVLLPRVLQQRQPRAVRVELSRAAVRVVVLTAAGAWLTGAAVFLNYPLLSDDYVFLERYQRLADLPYAPEFFRPLFALVFWIASTLGGGAPGPFHVIAIVLHLGSAVLTGALAQRLHGSMTVAVLAFAFFLLSPLQLEATLWVSGLQELLCAFFLLSAIALYAWTDGPTVRAVIAAVPLLACALLAKETAVAYLLLFPLIDVSLGRMPRLTAALLPYTILATVFATYMLVRRQFAALDADFFVAPSRYFIKQFVTIPYKFFVQPWNADVLHAPVMAFILCASVAVLVFAAVARGRITRRVLVGPLIVIATSLPLHSLFFINADLMAARYLYLPYVGWSVLLADLLTAVTARRALLAPAVFLLICGYLSALRVNLQPWITAAGVIRVMEHAVRQGEDPKETVKAIDTRLGLGLLLRADGVPVEYKGVGILLNGYEEFIKAVRNRPS